MARPLKRPLQSSCAGGAGGAGGNGGDASVTSTGQAIGTATATGGVGDIGGAGGIGANGTNGTDGGAAALICHRHPHRHARRARLVVAAARGYRKPRPGRPQTRPGPWGVDAINTLSV